MAFGGHGIVPVIAAAGAAARHDGLDELQLVLTPAKYLHELIV